jgi:hypothetical protein
VLQLAISLRRCHKFKSPIGCKSESNTAIECKQSAGRLRFAQANWIRASAIAFAKSEDVGADLEVLLVVGGEAFGGFQFLVGAASAFFEGLHPQGFGDVGNGFGEAELWINQDFKRLRKRCPRNWDGAINRYRD